MNLKQLEPYIKNIFYIINHKINILKAAKIAERRYGFKLDLLTLLKHDLSKFSKEEFKAYSLYFFLDKNSNEKIFDNAWNHHKLKNKHHWQYWYNEETGETKIIPKRYVHEMLVDWLAMELYNGMSSDLYYLKNYTKIKLSERTRIYIEYRLGLNKSYKTDNPMSILQILTLDKSQHNLINKIDFVRKNINYHC